MFTPLIPYANKLKITKSKAKLNIEYIQYFVGSLAAKARILFPIAKNNNIAQETTQGIALLFCIAGERGITLDSNINSIAIPITKATCLKGEISCSKKEIFCCCANFYYDYLKDNKYIRNCLTICIFNVYKNLELQTTTTSWLHKSIGFVKKWISISTSLQFPKEFCTHFIA